MNCTANCNQGRDCGCMPAEACTELGISASDPLTPIELWCVRGIVLWCVVFAVVLIGWGVVDLWGMPR